MYSDEEKIVILNILKDKDFDIKNSVIKYNEEYRHDVKEKLQRQTIYEWLEKDTNFKKANDTNRRDLIKEAEGAHRLLRKGLPVCDDEGILIGWIEKPDRAANEFFLKTHDPENYNIPERHDLSSKDGTMTPPAIEFVKFKNE